MGTDNSEASGEFVRVDRLEEVAARHMPVVSDKHAPPLVIADGQRCFAGDNRCSHLGFPLQSKFSNLGINADRAFCDAPPARDLLRACEHARRVTPAAHAECPSRRFLREAAPHGFFGDHCPDRRANDVRRNGTALVME